MHQELCPKCRVLREPIFASSKKVIDRQGHIQEILAKVYYCGVCGSFTREESKKMT